MNSRLLIIMATVTAAITTSACNHPRVFVGTGTLVGLEATPGNIKEGQTPAVTFGYRRGEVALVPVEKEDQNKVGRQNTASPPKAIKDAASTLATFNLAYNWFGPARIEQYVATGFAARNILASNQYALALIGYEKGADELADKLADAYEKARKDKATNQDMACWQAVTEWMNANFLDLPPTDILIRGFRQQRANFRDTDTNNVCKLKNEEPRQP